MRKADLRLAGAERPDAAAAHAAGAGDARERQVRPEQGPHRVADRRHRHAPQHRGGRNGRGRHDEQCRHGAADGRRHVGHRSGSRGRRDRHPERAARTDGEDHDRRHARQDLHREGHRDRQQPDPDDRAGAATQATNFKVVAHARRGDPRRAARASPARPRSRPPPAKALSPCRSRRRPSARWCSTTRATSCASP